MAGPFRHKAGFGDFTKRMAPMRLRILMTVKNKADPRPGFERTLATRDMPMLGAEMASGQSLKDGRRQLKAKPGMEKYFRRGKGFFKGDEE